MPGHAECVLRLSLPKSRKSRSTSPESLRKSRCPCPRSNSTVNTAFDARDGISTSTKGEVREAVDHALELLDKGETRVAERGADGKWKVNQWLKKAVLLSFRLNDMGAIPGGPGKASWWDKVPVEVRGLGREPFSRRRFPRRPRRDRAPLRLHRPQRRADAVFRQSRRVCR